MSAYTRSRTKASSQEITWQEPGRLVRHAIFKNMIA